MKSFNKAMILGHLAQDVSLRSTKNGIAVASFAVVTNRATVDAEGVKREIADFHNVVAWKGLAEVCNQYLKKGSPVLIEGRIINRSYDDKEGKRHFRTEIVANNINILSFRKSKSGDEIEVKNIDTKETEEEMTSALEAAAV